MFLKKDNVDVYIRKINRPEENQEWRHNSNEVVSVM